MTATAPSLRSRFMQGLRRTGRALFGEVQWQPPGWLARLGRALSQALAWMRAHPRITAAWVLALALAGVAGLFAWQWYHNRPQPVLTTFEVSDPSPTCYSCEPPGPPQPLIVEFSDSAAPLESLGQPVDAAKAGIRVSPAIAGQWRWDDERTLVFQPASDWPIGQRYKVTLSKQQSTAAHVSLQTYDFNFSSPAFQAELEDTQFHQDPVVATDKKVVASLAFTHPVAPESLERRIKLRLFEQVNDRTEKELAAPQFTVLYDRLRLAAYVHTQALEVPPKSARLQLIVEPGVRAARGGNASAETLQAEVTVPGLNSLAVEEMSLDIVRDERNQPDQVLLVRTSFSVNEQEFPKQVQAWLLPEQHPDPKLRPSGSAANQPFRWSVTNFRPEVLTENTRLPLTAMPGEQEHNTLHSLKYQAQPGRFIYVRIAAGMRSFGGYVLGETVERIIQVPQFPREVSILHEGSLLALSGDKRLSLMARNVPALRVELGRVQPDQLQHLVSQTSGSFQMPRFNGWSFQADHITERFEKIITLPQGDPARALYESIDLADYLNAEDGGRRGIFMVRVEGWDPARKRAINSDGDQWNDAQRGLSDARLIVVTDLGMVIKRNVSDERDVFVQSIATGEPVAGAQVQVIAANGQPVLSRTTDAQGHARLPNLSSFKRERAPVLVLARLGQDSSFLPLDYRGQMLEMSRFDVGGLYASAEAGALNAYLFSDRGIYRPGEEIRVGALVRSQDWQRPLQNLPLRLDVTDPQGTLIRRETFRPGLAGFGEIIQPTKLTAPTGTYTLMLSVVRNERRADPIGSTTVQVRDFQPDRLRMRAQFSSRSPQGWVSPDALQAELELENLFGTPAQNRRITAELVLSPAVVAFETFPDYRFHDPQLAEEGFREELAATTTDAAGKATLDLNLQRFARATYRLQLVAQGFEADGGRGVSAAATQMVSNMPYLLGYKADGDLDYLPRGSQRTIEMIAIDPTAQLAAVSDLTLVRLETRYVSVLTRQNNGTYKYESRRKETTLEETPLSLPASAHSLRLDTNAPGSFAYVVRDAQEQQLLRLDYAVAGEGNVSRTLEREAELEMTLSKRDYQPGEEIELSIRAPYEGAGLITIEREGVYAWKWFKASSTASVQRIRLPDDLEGNAYVSVALVRDPGSSQIYTSPLSYGVQSFSIDIAARRNPVTVKAPARVKPGETLTIEYSTQRPSRVVLFAVDEGILQVANYRTPDPLGHFFRKRALQVSTTQILDLILPQFSQLMQAAPGGDAEGLLARHLNPFRRKGEPPVAFWSGIVEADATTRQVTYQVPDYFNGTLRIMAVAVNDASVGVHQSRAVVRGDFVMSPNAPTTVSPGDEFEVSVGLANNVEGSGAQARIAVKLATDAGLEVIGDAQQTVAIGEGNEDSVRFRLRAGKTPGAVDLRFDVSTTTGGKQFTGQRRIDLSVRPATPYRTQLRAGLLPRGERDVAVDRKLHPHHRRLEVGASMLPLQFAHGFNAYLANYPYVCTEQIVSQAMPAVLLSSRPEFGEVHSQPGGDLAALLAELRARQNGVGAYRVWPGSQEVAEFVSLYAQQLLIEASEREQPVSADLITSGNEYLRQLAGRDGNSLAEERHSAYAIYLLTRQGQRMAAEAAGVRQRLNERYRDQWQRDPVAGWLAGAFKLMRQENEARAMISAARFSDGKGEELYNDAMTRDALLLFILSRHFPERLTQVPSEVFATMAQRITEGHYHSLSAGTTLLALDAYASATEAASGNLSVAEVLASKQIHALSLPEGLLPRVDFSEQATALRFNNRNPLDAYYLIEESGFDIEPPQQAISNGLEVLRQYTDMDGKPIEKLTLGQQVNVHLRFRALGGRELSNVALVDLLPGGFELVVPTAPLEGTGDDEYQDDAYAVWQCQICVGTPASSLHYADMREDRVVFYANATGSIAEVVYRIRATNTGSFVVPPAHGEAMYDRSVIGRSAAGRIEVQRP